MITRYSASANKHDSIDCFLDFQEIGEFPSKMPYLVMDRLVS